MSRIVSEGWGNSQDWIVPVSCGTKDAEVEYASAFHWSSGGVWGAIDIFFFLFFSFNGMESFECLFFFNSSGLGWGGMDQGDKGCGRFLDYLEIEH